MGVEISLFTLLILQSYILWYLLGLLVEKNKSWLQYKHVNFTCFILSFSSFFVSIFLSYPLTLLMFLILLVTICVLMRSFQDSPHRRSGYKKSLVHLCFMLILNFHSSQGHSKHTRSFGILDQIILIYTSVPSLVSHMVGICSILHEADFTEHAALSHMPLPGLLLTPSHWNVLCHRLWSLLQGSIEKLIPPSNFPNTTLSKLSLLLSKKTFPGIRIYSDVLFNIISFSYLSLFLNLLNLW